MKERLTKREVVGALKGWAAMHGKPLTPEHQALESGLRAPRKKRDPKAPTEHREQVRVIWWWRKNHEHYNLPEFALFAIPNGSQRGLVAGARLKSEGVRPGVFDLFLAKPSGDFSGLFCEMKCGRGMPTAEQYAFKEYAAGVAYRAVVCWTGDEAIEQIKTYLA